MRKPQLGNRRVPIRPIRKGAIPVRVATETETESVTGQDAVEVSAETTGQSAKEIDEPEDAVDVTESEDASSDEAHAEDAEDVTPPARWRRIKWSRVLAFGVLPLLAVVTAAGAGFLKWQDAWIRGSKVAGIESVAAAKDSTVALLSYQPDTVDKDLRAARDRLTGGFKDSYTQLIQDVVIQETLILWELTLLAVLQYANPRSRPCSSAQCAVSSKRHVSAISVRTSYREEHQSGRTPFCSTCRKGDLGFQTSVLPSTE